MMKYSSFKIYNTLTKIKNNNIFKFVTLLMFRSILLIGIILLIAIILLYYGRYCGTQSVNSLKLWHNKYGKLLQSLKISKLEDISRLYITSHDINEDSIRYKIMLIHHHKIYNTNIDTSYFYTTYNSLTFNKNTLPMANKDSVYNAIQELSSLLDTNFRGISLAYVNDDTTNDRDDGKIFFVTIHYSFFNWFVTYYYTYQNYANSNFFKRYKKDEGNKFIILNKNCFIKIG